MRCPLGVRKLRRIAALTGRTVRHASVRGGEEHFWALVQFADGSTEYVNYKTGATRPDPLQRERDR